jgi:glycosyl transferase family 25
MGGSGVTEPARSGLGVWLINLQSAEERRAAMSGRLAGLGLPYRLFPAIDGRTEEARLRPRVDEAAYARNMGQPLLPGKMGVYASHVAVWEEFLASPFDTALILEDDVVFHDDFLEALELGLQAGAHWDILRFTHIRAKLPVSQGRVGPYRLTCYIGPFTGNGCYLIRREVAGRLLPAIWPQTRALDHELNRFFRHDLRLCGLEPWPAHVDDGGHSTITGAAFADVRKPRWHKRVPHYRLKAANYLRRFWWLLTHGRLVPSGRDLLRPAP